MSDCGCGRSPTGKCVGWHNLTEEQYQEKKAAYEAKQAAKSSAAQDNQEAGYSGLLFTLSYHSGHTHSCRGINKRY